MFFVELLYVKMVVVVIIGVLIAIAATIFNQATTRAETAAIEANLRTINGFIMMIMASEAQATDRWVVLHFGDAAHGDWSL